MSGVAAAIADEDMVSFHYSYSGIAGVREMLLDAETRRRGGRRREGSTSEGKTGIHAFAGWRRKLRTRREEVRAALGWTRRSLIPLGSLCGGELPLQRADEFTQRVAVRGLPPDEDEEAAAVEEDGAGSRLPALHDVQRDGGRSQLVEARVEPPGTFVRSRANAFHRGPRYGVWLQRRREFACGRAMPGAHHLGEDVGH